MISRSFAVRAWVALMLSLVLSASGAHAAELVVKPDNARGVDASVDYVALLAYGPWDDRNYQLTAADIAVLPVKD
ncbi:MAG: hypothetical protein AB7K14_04210, partial [Lysobacterales bacterium]